MNKKIVGSLIVVLVGAIIWFLPVPAGLKPQAMHLLAIFTATIVGFIMQPFPTGVVAFTALGFSALSGTLSVSEVLSGFSSGTVWLIVSAFLISRAFIKSGLGRRIAFVLMKNLGDSSLKLGYALVLSNLVISPAIPSNTARAGGIMFPIVRSLAAAFGSQPGATARKIGAYLMQTAYHGDILASGMTMTAQAGNLLVVVLIAKTINIDVSWGLWFSAAVVPGIISIMLLPYFLYKIYPPELKKTPETRQLATAELSKMGPMTAKEKIFAVVFVGAILAWGTSSITKVDATVVAMMAVVVMLAADIINWQDVIEEKGAWDAMIWMGGIFGLATYLDKLGLIAVFAKWVTASLEGVPWVFALIAVVLIFVYSTYAFASAIAHVTAMYAAFLAVAVATGAPPYLAALILGFSTALYQGLTHYASGPSAIFFGAGYVDQKTWWRLGLIIVTLNLVIWGGAGSIWWKVIGLW